MPTELAHARAALIRHVATFDSVASLDAWLEAKTEEDPLLNTPLPLAEAIREAGYILARFSTSNRRATVAGGFASAAL